MLRVLAALTTLVLSSPAYSAGFDALARRFAESEFVFNRARSDVPFIPLAWIDVSAYGDTRFRMPSGEATEISFEQTTLSMAMRSDGQSSTSAPGISG